MPSIACAVILSIIFNLWALGAQAPILSSHDAVDGPLGGERHIEDIQIFGDGRVIYTVESTIPVASAKLSRSSYRFRIGADQVQYLNQLMDLPDIRSLPGNMPPKIRPTDFFWDKVLQINRTDGTQKIHIENFYPFLNLNGPAYPQALIKLECTLQGIESAAASRPKEQDDWCTGVMSRGASARGVPECNVNESQPRIVAGEGWGSIRLGADLSMIEGSLGNGEQGKKYSDSYFREFPERGIEIMFNKNDTVRAIFFYHGQLGSENLGSFCGQTNKGISWQSSTDDVKGVYGRPTEDFSGRDSGGAWERLVFSGIDFRFENGKLVRIGIPGR